MSVIVNGRPDGSVAPMDRGLQYGDGLFETLAVESGRALCLDQHLTRLMRGCAQLGIAPVDVDELGDACRRLAGETSRGVIKIVLTRGTGGRGYAPPPACTPTRIVSLHGWPDYPPSAWHEGIAVATCTTRLGLSPVLAGLKHLNRLEQVLARAEVSARGLDEGLMLDPDGRVVEGTMSNLFLVTEGRLATPDLSRCGVRGIMRDLVLDIARARGVKADAHARVAPGDLDRADEVFVCNSVLGIWPVRLLHDRRLQPGPVTRVLQSDVLARGAVPRYAAR